MTEGTDLVVAARVGDRRALAELNALHLPLVYHVAGRALHVHADIAHAVRRTFARAARELAQLRDPDRFRGWLLACAVREIAGIQAAGTGVSTALDGGPADPSADFVSLAIVQHDLTGRRRELDEATRWIDGEHSVVLALWWLEAAGLLTRAEVADALRMPPDDVTGRVTVLREQWEQARALVGALRAHPGCPELAVLTDGWDHLPAPAWRRGLGLHVGDCPVCGAAIAGLPELVRLLGEHPLVPVPAALVGALATDGLVPPDAARTNPMLGGTPPVTPVRSSATGPAGPAPGRPGAFSAGWAGAPGTAAAAAAAAGGVAATPAAATTRSGELSTESTVDITAIAAATAAGAIGAGTTSLTDTGRAGSSSAGRAGSSADRAEATTSGTAGGASRHVASPEARGGAGSGAAGEAGAASEAAAGDAASRRAAGNGTASGDARHADSPTTPASRHASGAPGAPGQTGSRRTTPSNTAGAVAATSAAAAADGTAGQTSPRHTAASGAAGEAASRRAGTAGAAVGTPGQAGARHTAAAGAGGVSGEVTSRRAAGNAAGGVSGEATSRRAAGSAAGGVSGEATPRRAAGGAAAEAGAGHTGTADAAGEVLPRHTSGAAGQAGARHAGSSGAAGGTAGGRTVAGSGGVVAGKADGTAALPMIAGKRAPEEPPTWRGTPTRIPGPATPAEPEAAAEAPSWTGAPTRIPATDAPTAMLPAVSGGASAAAAKGSHPREVPPGRPAAGGAAAITAGTVAIPRQRGGDADVTAVIPRVPADDRDAGDTGVLAGVILPGDQFVPPQTASRHIPPPSGGDDDDDAGAIVPLGDAEEPENTGRSKKALALAGIAAVVALSTTAGLIINSVIGGDDDTLTPIAAPSGAAQYAVPPVVEPSASASASPSPSASASPSPSASASPSPSAAAKPSPSRVPSVAPSSPAAPPGGGTTADLRSLRMASSERYVRVSGGSVTVERASAGSSGAAFQLVPGLANAGCVSLRTPDGRYLRHYDYRVRADGDDGSALFKADATFCMQQAGGAVMLRSHNFPDHFLRARDSGLFITQLDRNAAGSMLWVLTDPIG
ncbi:MULTISPECIES: AbfB domain-containing protein [Catenuloplanes]|uniref:DNA-directed RNA polymerase specialized sigma24 family protein n=1 Tax=Catenuloplanes niger TaxID=587534 RepID=A0AAE4CZD2_9ACTN|nr:AbfB domain-containing protein [Catenuloplanes niger]MDR7326789.1 DNA-directed RNA polymerase specialized sigma24 family protein [Catenuloplanes niger]